MNQNGENGTFGIGAAKTVLPVVIGQNSLNEDQEKISLPCQIFLFLLAKKNNCGHFFQAL